MDKRIIKIKESDSELLEESDKEWEDKIKKKFETEYLISVNNNPAWVKEPGEFTILARRWGDKETGYVEEYNLDEEV